MTPELQAEPLSPEEAARRRERRAQREVNALHKRVEAFAELAAEGDDPKAAGDLLLAVAKQKSDNAGLAKRTATKLEATVNGPRTTDAWLAAKQAESDDDE